MDAETLLNVFLSITTLIAGGGWFVNYRTKKVAEIQKNKSDNVDLTDKIFWAAALPHQLGNFVAVDLATLDILPSERWIAADPMLASGEFAAYTNSLRMIGAARTALRAGNAAQALAEAERAAAENPGFYKILWTKADALNSLGQTSEAQTAYRAALDAMPPFPSEQAELRRIVFPSKMEKKD